MLDFIAKCLWRLYRMGALEYIFGSVLILCEIVCRMRSTVVLLRTVSVFRIVGCMLEISVILKECLFRAINTGILSKLCPVKKLGGGGGSHSANSCTACAKLFFHFIAERVFGCSVVRHGFLPS